IPIALHVVYGEDIGTHILAAIMLYTIAEHCSLRVAVAGLLAEYGLITVNVFTPPISGQFVFQGFYYFAFLLGFVFFAGRAQRYRRGPSAPPPPPTPPPPHPPAPPAPPPPPAR